ncbi:MAG: ABC transporter permease [Angustibacter sp.]
MSLVARARALWQVRGILGLLIRRDLKVRYAGSALGYVWTILDPLLMTGVYWFVFTVVFIRGGGEQPYILFLILGLLSWQWFSASVTETSRALTSETRLVRSTRLPREIWVLKVVGSKGLEFFFSLPVVVLFMALYRKPPAWELVLFPLAVLLQAILLTGIGLALAAATVLVRDLQRVVRIGLRVMFYLSPVIYSVNSINIGALRELFALNPLTGIIELYRAVAFPDVFAGWGVVGVAALICVLALLAGAVIFRRLENAVLKEL